MTKIIAISDMHGQLPDDLPPCDILVIGGDICPDYLDRPENGVLEQAYWLDLVFREWLWEQDAECIIGIAGNHDFVFEKKHLIPKLPWAYLEDAGVTLYGKKFWGTPWVPNLPRWAFYGSPGALEARSALVPEDVDVLITHGPPYGTLDVVPGGSKRHNLHPLNVGDPSILRAIRDRRPGIVICGHIHESHGSADLHYSAVYNTSLLDDTYTAVYPYTEIDL